MNEPEYLTFEYKEAILSTGILIKNRKELFNYIKGLSEKYKIRMDKIIFNHDFDKQKDDTFKFLKGKNFALKGSYDYLKNKRGCNA